MLSVVGVTLRANANIAFQWAYTWCGARSIASEWSVADGTATKGDRRGGGRREGA
jgi:hypothetical protein